MSKMLKTQRGSLSRYVERVIKEKHLSRRDVQLRSGGEITESYVSGIISGTFRNLSIDKLKALARGLRVPEKQLVRVALELSEEQEIGTSKASASDKSHNLLLLDIAKKNFIGADVAEIVHEVLKLSPTDRAIVLQYVRRLGRAERRINRGRHTM